MSIFYGTEIDIWAGFGPVGITEKTFLANYEQLVRAVFLFFHEQNFFSIFFKNIVVFELKSYMK